MVDCADCGKKLGLLSKFKHKDDDGNVTYYCYNCNNLRTEVHDILLFLGFDDEKEDLDFFVEKGRKREIKSEITYGEIMKKLEGKKITEEAIREIVNYKREVWKIKRREQKAKLMEKAEKEYYGNIKTKREPLGDLKEAIYSKYNNECAVCGAKEGLHVHHKDDNPKNNKINNLILLCGVCHKKIHMKVR